MHTQLTGIHHFKTRDPLTIILTISNEMSINFVGINLANGSSRLLYSFDKNQYENAFIRSISEDIDEAGQVHTINIYGACKKKGEDWQNVKITMKL